MRVSSGHGVVGDRLARAGWRAEEGGGDLSSDRSTEDGGKKTFGTARDGADVGFLGLRMDVEGIREAERGYKGVWILGRFAEEVGCGSLVEKDGDGEGGGRAAVDFFVFWEL